MSRKLSRSPGWDVQVSGSTYWPSNSCIPKRAKTTMNRKRRNNRLMMDFMELRRETTRFLRDAQYLPTDAKVGIRAGYAR